MKQKFKTGILVIVLGLFVNGALAQDRTVNSSPRWVSELGYWVVESNITQPKDQTIWFYNNENILVYKETISGKNLNLNRRKVKMELKKVLENSIQSWNATRQPQHDKNYVVTALK